MLAALTTCQSRSSLQCRCRTQQAVPVPSNETKCCFCRLISAGGTSSSCPCASCIDTEVTLRVWQLTKIQIYETQICNLSACKLHAHRMQMGSVTLRKIRSLHVQFLVPHSVCMTELLQCEADIVQGCRPCGLRVCSMLARHTVYNRVCLCHELISHQLQTNKEKQSKHEEQGSSAMLDILQTKP